MLDVPAVLPGEVVSAVHVTVYDAWYVALAEALDATLVTADLRLVGATGPRCEIADVRTFARP